jgi:hypothetical protein
MYKNQDIKERIVRVLIFVILSFIMLRYLLGLELSDIDQTQIVLGLTVCFMFVNTYYPVVITNH